MSRVGPPAKQPCSTCPYRRDVPAGVWDRSEYEKLPAFDLDTPFQPAAVFLCHLLGAGDRARICAGWAGCHDLDHSLGLRVAVSSGQLSPEDYVATRDYQTEVPLFGSGREAAAHGMAEYDRPGPHAAQAIHKIRRAQEGTR